MRAAGEDFCEIMSRNMYRYSTDLIDMLLF
jgi:hypothetical protein